MLYIPSDRDRICTLLRTLIAILYWIKSNNTQTGIKCYFCTIKDKKLYICILRHFIEESSKDYWFLADGPVLGPHFLNASDSCWSCFSYWRNIRCFRKFWRFLICVIKQMRKFACWQLCLEVLWHKQWFFKTFTRKKCKMLFILFPFLTFYSLVSCALSGSNLCLHSKILRANY
jgi:hypothetical protein